MQTQPTGIKIQTALCPLAELLGFSLKAFPKYFEHIYVLVCVLLLPHPPSTAPSPAFFQSHE